MRAVCFQHVPFEGPGAFAAALERHGVQLERVLVPQEGLAKDAGDLLIVIGGPMSEATTLAGQGTILSERMALQRRLLEPFVRRAGRDDSHF